MKFNNILHPTCEYPVNKEWTDFKIWHNFCWIFFSLFDMDSGKLVNSIAPQEGSVFLGMCNTSPASVVSAVYTGDNVYVIMVRALTLLKMYDKVYLAWYFCFDPICKRFSETKKEGRMGLQHDIILKGLSNNSSSYCSPWAGILSYYLASLLFYMYIMYFLSCSYDKSDARKLKKCFIHVLIIIWNRIYCGFINIHGHQFSCK